jgi:hypothetical protein
MTVSDTISQRPLGWRAPILKHFTPEIAAATRLTVVADPDFLLTEQEILGALGERGFDLVPFEDHVAFRFAYESRYRQIWDRGEETNLVVVLRSPMGDVDDLPYDLLEKARRQGRCLSFSVAELFPKLAASVVLDLDRALFDPLFAAQATDDTVRLGVNATKDFVLLNVFEIAPKLIKAPPDLLKVLLRRHYRGQSFPESLDERFVHLLRAGGGWEDWPLEEIVPNRAAFLGFLNERWPSFVARMVATKGTAVAEPEAGYGLTYSGPLDLPFGHDEVKVYIDNLFQEGQLTPVGAYRAIDMPEAWMRVGVAGSDGDDESERFGRLLSRLRKELPTLTASCRDWVDYTRIWAEWTALRWIMGDAKTGVPTAQCDELHDGVEGGFEEWMHRNYASLHNLSPALRPTMVHHIPQYMAHHFTPTGAGAPDMRDPKKHALIVVDGLAFDQWVVMRDAISEQLGAATQFEEDGVFAWVPTLTSVSRQAIFSGLWPELFESSIGNTAKEPNQWIRFWEDHGARRPEIGYVKEGTNQSDEDFLQAVLEVAEHPKMRMLGIVVGKVDQSMHGVKMGSSGLHATVREWCKSGGMAKLLEALLDRGYEVNITADHGNIHGRGIGKPQVGAIADDRGQRAHRFSDELTRSKTASEYPNTIEWPQIGLPKSWWVLLAANRGVFVSENQQIVAHGGMAMEEVIVPFVKVLRRDG